jgi:outer membrane biosynthesis protein TonB
MFDSVGRVLDEDATSRAAKSTLLTLLLAGSVGVGLTSAGMFMVQAYVAPVIEPPIYEIAQVDEEELSAPAPPAPPPPAAAAAPAPEAEPADAPTPDEMAEDVQDLEAEVKPEVASATKPAGVEDGDPTGIEDGVVDGRSTGPPCTLPCGDGIGPPSGSVRIPPKVQHHSEVLWKRRIDPVYPQQAKGQGYGEQTCKVTVELDEGGAPSNLRIDGCPTPFHGETREALMKWRSYPYKVGGVAMRVQTTIIIRYREVL